MGIPGTEQPMRPTPPGDVLSFAVRAHPAEVSVARRTVGQFLDGYHAPRHIVDDVTLLTSELVTNALRHGEPGSIDVAVRVQPSVDVTLSVANPGPVSAIPPVATWRAPSGLALSGRGLGIVRAISDDVEVRGDDQRAEVVCRRAWNDEEQTT